MTMHAGYVVTLAENVHVEDAEAVINALRMVRGVVSVEPVVADTATHIGQMRADVKWRNKLADLIHNGVDGPERS